MAARSAICAVCLRVVGLELQGKPVRHGHRMVGGRQSAPCPGVRFPPLGESLEGTIWALDQEAQRLLTLRDEQLVHKLRPFMRATASVLDEHGLEAPPLLVNAAQEMDPSWDRRESDIEAEILLVGEQVDRYRATIAEWKPGKLLTNAVIHLCSVWKGRPGTVVPRCYREADQRPQGILILTQNPGEVTCEACVDEKKSHQEHHRFQQTTK